MKQERHKQTRTPLYRIWEAMRQRCANPNHGSFQNYGGRGITVCHEWDSFTQFARDMGERPSGKSLNRKDNNGNYSPENCEWSDLIVQNNNKRTNRTYTISGQTKTLTQWSRFYGRNRVTVDSRLKRGLDIYTALTLETQPAGRQRR